MLITFEGPDGGGKTTQLELLAGYLRRRGYVVRCTREPGGTELGDKIRGLLLDPANREMAPRTETLLYMAARAQHVAEVIAFGERAAAELASLQETAYLLRSPQNATRLLEALNRAVRRTQKPETVEALRRELGLDIEK